MYSLTYYFVLLLYVAYVSFDVWAQMPPQIFFQQYKSYPDSKPSQFPGIVTGADKRCAPGWRIAPRCAKMPKSPLPDDTYGKLTDRYNKAFREDFMPSTEFGRNYRHNKLDTVRPRYINSGSESHDCLNHPTVPLYRRPDNLLFSLFSCHWK